MAFGFSLDVGVSDHQIIELLNKLDYHLMLASYGNFHHIEDIVHRLKLEPTSRRPIPCCGPMRALLPKIAADKELPERVDRPKIVATRNQIYQVRRAFSL